MPLYQLLTDRTLAQSSAITPTTLIHIVYTGDPSQNPAGSSYKAELGQLVGLFSGASDTLVTGGTYSAGTITFTNNSGGTFNVSGLTEPFTGGTVSGATIFTGGLSANTFSATTYLNLPISGTHNYLSKFSSGSTILVDSQIQDDGTSVSVGTTLNPNVKLNVRTSTQDYSIFSFNNKTSGIGILGQTQGIGNSVGVYGFSNGSTASTTNTGVYGLAYNAVTTIGIRGKAQFGTNNYSAQLQDGTEGIGKVLTSMTSDGKANWQTLPSSTFTGGTVSGATNFTNGLTANTFSASSIFVNGVQITGDTFVTGGTFLIDTLTFTNNQGNNFQVTGITASGTTFTGGSGNCIADLYVTNIHGCSPITIYDSIKSTGSTVSGLTSFSFGFETSATTDYSFAIGVQTLASGPYSHAEGFGTVASGNISKAEGIQTVAAEWGSHAEGGYYNGLNFAPGGKALAWGSHAEGTLTIASGVSSHSEGVYTVTLGWGSHAEGGYIDGGPYSGGTAVGMGSHAEGQETISSGTSSHSEGWLTNSSGSYSHAEGQLTLSLGQSSHAEGQNTISSGDWSHTEGSSTIASGNWSHAEGSQTVASGDFSHAEGFGTLADGKGSHAEGGYFLHPTYVSGGTALGRASHAEGVKTTAYGIASHAEGDETYSFGFGSHAEGNGTYTSGTYQHATGKWNLTADTSSGAFIIGNGTSDLNRSNLLFAAGNEVNISGKTITTNFQMTSGATNGYVLTSDASGNGSWQPSTGGGGTFTGGTVTGPTTFTNGLTANTISATTYQNLPYLGALTANTNTINFTGQTIYYNSTTPTTGNILNDLTNAKLGLVQKIYHNDVTEPTYPAGWVLLGDAIYFTSTLNIIYAEWAGGTRVEYWYVQEQ